MKFGKTSIGLTAAALLLLMVAPTFACGPTSLEVWKEITDIRVQGDQVTIEVQIFLQNDPDNTGQILQIVDHVEAKYRGNSWETVATWVLHSGSIWNIPPGTTTPTAVFHLTFEKGRYTAYRNVVEVLLGNHPTGERWFHYTLSFDIPE